MQNVCCPFSPSLLGLLSLQPDQHGLLGKYTTYNFLKSTFHILMFIFKKPLQRKEPLIYKSLISITEWESVFYQIMTKTKCSRPLQYSTLQHKDFFFHRFEHISKMFLKVPVYFYQWDLEQWPGDRCMYKSVAEQLSTNFGNWIRQTFLQTCLLVNGRRNNLWLVTW